MEIRCSKAVSCSFNCANVKQLRHYAILTLINDKPDAILIQSVTYDILNHANQEDVASSFINTGLDCKNNGVNEVFISSILVKKNPNLTAIVH